jgi:hypothetical protein
LATAAGGGLARDFAVFFAALPVFVIANDFSAINVAIPQIEHDFKTIGHMIMLLHARRIIFRERYTHDEQAALLWEGQEYGDGRQWLLLPQQL